MDGLLVVDKPSGPTSHDVVARVRRVLREPRIGHTGTLDPMASGVLPLVIGRATRLARFMTADEKRYDAVVRLGFATDTADAEGQVAGPVWTGGLPHLSAIDAALNQFRGTFAQQPPAFSAKKVGGERSYRLARQRGNDAPASLPLPAAVTAFSIDVVSVEGDRIALAVACSSGFYVRSLAHDLGAALGIGAHLAALRRTATSGVTLAEAVALDDLESGRRSAADGVVPMDRLLQSLPGVELTPSGVKRATHGQDLSAADATVGFPCSADEGTSVRLLDGSGGLIGIGERSERPGFLHPAVILM